jgi:hypothetical protein
MKKSLLFSIFTAVALASSPSCDTEYGLHCPSEAPGDGLIRCLRSCLLLFVCVDDLFELLVLFQMFLLHVIHGKSPYFIYTTISMSMNIGFLFSNSQAHIDESLHSGLEQVFFICFNT